MLSKIPERVRADFTRRKGAKDWDLPLLRGMLADEIRALDSYKLTNSLDVNTKERRQDRRPLYNNATRLPMTTLALLSNEKRERQIVSCAFCFERHFSDECKKYTSRQARINRLKETRSCFKCLKKNHLASDCKRVKRCFHCQDNNVRVALVVQLI